MDGITWTEKILIDGITWTEKILIDGITGTEKVLIDGIISGRKYLIRPGQPSLGGRGGESILWSKDLIGPAASPYFFRLWRKKRLGGGKI